MPKQHLTGTLDEQCDFLYHLAQEKMAQGNFTGAVHALKEVAKYKPGDQTVQALLAEATRRKSTQSTLLLSAFLGAALFIGIGTLIRLGNDLLFILLALAGTLIGYLVGNIVLSRRSVKNNYS